MPAILNRTLRILRRFFTTMAPVLVSAIVLAFPAMGQNEISKMENKYRMKVEVWSDVMCPFCYIGKRKFEQALEAFPHAGEVEIIWKSYMLSPDLQTDPAKTMYQHLADAKGISLEESKKMHAYVSEMAAKVGLEYDFDRAVVSNSFRAHQFSHFALEFGKQNEAEELLFAAHFSQGKNVDDEAVLMDMATELGLDANALKGALLEEKYAEAVQNDIYEAHQLGVRGVPFFVFNEKYAVSGAQETSVFVQTLERAHSEWVHSQQKRSLEVVDGPVCTPDGSCD